MNDEITYKTDIFGKNTSRFLFFKFFQQKNVFLGKFVEENLLPTDHFCNFAFVKGGIKYVWARILRLPRQWGFGLQSPFAVRVERDVVSAHLRYYAYEKLDAQRPKADAPAGSHSKEMDHLLLRVANFVQPACIALPDTPAWLSSLPYLKAGCRHAQTILYSDHTPPSTRHLPTDAPILFCCEGNAAWAVQDFSKIPDLHPESAVVVAPIRHHQASHRVWAAWKGQGRARAVFDLYGAGLIFCNPTLSYQYHRLAAIV